MDNETLILDLLAWIGDATRPYGEVMEAWRSTCPRLTIWEDACDAGLVEVGDGHVVVTPRGRSWLAARRPATALSGRAA